MGIHDREYYRGDEEQGVRWGFNSPAQSFNLKLIAALIVSFVVCVLAGGGLTRMLSLSGDTLFKPWLWWQFITYAFVHDTNSGWHLAGNLLGLWFFGSEVEAVYGKRTYIGLFFSAVVLGALVWTTRIMFFGPDEASALANYMLMGASGGVTAVVMLFCMKFPTRTILLAFVLPAPAWLLGVLIVLSDVMTGKGATGGGIAFDVHLTGAVLAAVVFRYGHRFGWVGGPPRRVRRGGGGGGRRSWFSWLTPKPKLKIHAPTSGEEIDPDVDYEELDERGDEVLAKWHREGEESLSPEERKILTAYSRRMKQKLR